MALNPAAALAMRKARRKTLIENDKTVPHVTNLSEDPQMSGIVYHSLTKGVILIGRKTGTPQPDIILGSIGIEKNHAKIELKPNGLFSLSVVPSAATATLINGQALKVSKPSRLLNHCDRISFNGNIYLFKYPKLKRALNKLIEMQ